MKRIPPSFQQYFLEMQESYYVGLMNSCSIQCDKCAMENECSILGFTLIAIKEKLESRDE